MQSLSAGKKPLEAVMKNAIWIEPSCILVWVQALYNCTKTLKEQQFQISYEGPNPVSLIGSGCCKVAVKPIMALTVSKYCQCLSHASQDCTSVQVASLSSTSVTMAIGKAHGGVELGRGRSRPGWRVALVCLSRGWLWRWILNPPHRAGQPDSGLFQPPLTKQLAETRVALLWEPGLSLAP